MRCGVGILIGHSCAAWLKREVPEAGEAPQFVSHGASIERLARADRLLKPSEVLRNSQNVDDRVIRDAIGRILGLACEPCGKAAENLGVCALPRLLDAAPFLEQSW